MKRSVLGFVMVLAAMTMSSLSVARAEGQLRPPAVPLVTCDPYLSVWSFNDRLTDADTRHWTGKPHTLLSLVRIDGKPYRVMGPQPSSAPALEQTQLQVLPTRTIYTLAGGGVRLTLTFMTPMLPDDLDVLSRPLTYVTWHAASTDGRPHEVTAMLAVGGDLAVNRPEQAILARREKFGELTALVMGEHDGVLIEWYRRPGELDGRSLARAVRLAVIDGLRTQPARQPDLEATEASLPQAG